MLLVSPMTCNKSMSTLMALLRRLAFLQRVALTSDQYCPGDRPSVSSVYFNSDYHIEEKNTLVGFSRFERYSFQAIPAISLLISLQSHEDVWSWQGIFEDIPILGSLFNAGRLCASYGYWAVYTIANRLASSDAKPKTPG